MACRSTGNPLILCSGADNEKPLTLIYGSFAAKAAINLDLVGNVGKSFQNDERHDESSLYDRGEKHTDENCEEKQKHSADTARQKIVRLRQR